MLLLISDSTLRNGDSVTPLLTYDYVRFITARRFYAAANSAREHLRAAGILKTHDGAFRIHPRCTLGRA